MKLIPEIEKLRASPLFNLSLGSKELFHSNFLAWLFESYPKESGRALARYLKKGSGDSSIIRVFREQKNRDLTLHFKNGQELVIENKVKSLPYIEQLANYSEGAEPHQNFLLLSLLPPPFAYGGSIKTGKITWNILTYAELPAILKQITTRDEYHLAMLADYAAFVSSLGGLFKSNSISENEPFSEFHSPKEGSVSAQLRPLRMADIYQKLRYEALAGLLHKALLKIYPGMVGLSESRANMKVGHIYVSHDLFNTQGLVSIAYVLAKGLMLTVQIQGGSYRHMVQGHTGFGKASRGVAERLKAQGLWFDLTHLAAAKEYPRGTKEFNEFGGVDFYRSVKVPPKATVGQIVEFVVNDMKVIAKKKDEISAEI